TTRPPENSYHSHLGKRLFEQLEPLGRLLERQAYSRDVTPRSGNAFDETLRKRIASNHDNRYRACSIQRCFGGAVAVGHDQIDRKAHQLCCKSREIIPDPPSKAEFQNDRLALDVTQVAQPFT